MRSRSLFVIVLTFSLVPLKILWILHVLANRAPKIAMKLMLMQMGTTRHSTSWPASEMMGMRYVGKLEAMMR